MYNLRARYRFFLRRNKRNKKNLKLNFEKTTIELN